MINVTKSRLDVLPRGLTAQWQGSVKYRGEVVGFGILLAEVANEKR